MPWLKNTLSGIEVVTQALYRVLRNRQSVIEVVRRALYWPLLIRQSILEVGFTNEKKPLINPQSFLEVAWREPRIYTDESIFDQASGIMTGGAAFEEAATSGIHTSGVAYAKR